VAGGGGDWKYPEHATGKLKRARSPDDDGEHLRMSHRTRMDDDFDAERM
jgi:nuclear cap-binding protein subunit 2